MMNVIMLILDIAADIATIGMTIYSIYKMFH